MSWAAVIIGGATLASSALSADAADNASSTAEDVAARADTLERDKFDEAKRQADLLRKRGDDVSARQIEESVKAEIGAQKFEALSRTYADRANAAAAQRAKAGSDIYGKIQKRTDLNRTAGNQAVDALRVAKTDVLNAANRNEQLVNRYGERAVSEIDQATTGAQSGLRTSFSNTENRFSPFLTSERNAIGQLDAEMGLAPGSAYKGYRDTPAYMAAQDASRVAEAEGIRTIDQAAGNSGTLYSGSRGAALADRSKQGSYERAQLEQNYYQNYMAMLSKMANPTATTYVSNADMQTARDAGQLGVNSANQKAGLIMNAVQNVGNANMNAAGTAANITSKGVDTFLNTRGTGAEGADYMLNTMDPGTAGAAIDLNGVDRGTAGSQLRIDAANTGLNTQATAGGLITGNMPTGLQGNNARIMGTEAVNAAMADIGSAITTGASNYIRYNPNTPTVTNGAGGGYGPNYNTPYTPPTNGTINYLG